MVSYDQEIQRPGELHADSGGGADHRQPLGEAVGRVRRGVRRPEQEHVEGVAGVQMGVTPVEICLGRRAGGDGAGAPRRRSARAGRAAGAWW